MGLAFWGGFASGMSKGIENNRNRKQKQDKLQADTIASQKKTVADNQKKQYDLSEDTRKALDKVNEDIANIRSSDSNLTPEERVRETNRLNQQKMDIMKTSSERSIQIGDGTPIDMASEPIEKLGTVTVDGDKYIIDYNLASEIQGSDGGLKLEKNEVMKRVMQPKSTGQSVPVKNSDGSYKYESTGQFLKPFGDVYNTDKSGKNRKGTTTGISSDMSDTERKYFVDAGINPDTVSASVLDDGRKAMLKENIKQEDNKKKAIKGINFIDDRLDPKGENPIAWGTKVTGKDIIEARAAQPKGEKIDGTLFKELSGKLGIYSDGARIIEYISYNDVDFDLGETAKNEISKVTGKPWDGVMNLLGMSDDKLSSEDKKIKSKANAMMLNRITADTALQNMVANYVKIISGAAVTDEERKNFYNIITAGNYADDTAMLTAMTSFVDSIGSNYKNTYDSLKYRYPGDYTTSVKAWNDADKSSDIAKYRRKNEAKMNEDVDVTDKVIEPKTKSWKDYLKV